MAPSHITSSRCKAYFQTGQMTCQDVEPNAKGPGEEENLPQVDNRLPFGRIFNSSVSESEIS
jgi:hypothetical protein